MYDIHIITYRHNILIILTTKGVLRDYWWKWSLVEECKLRIGIVLICDKQLHDRLICLRSDVWVYKTSLTPHLCIEGRACTNIKPGRWIGHVYVCYEYQFLVSFPTSILLALFCECGHFCFPFYYQFDRYIMISWLIWEQSTDRYNNMAVEDPDLSTCRRLEALIPEMNIAAPIQTAYSVYISQLIWYSKACAQYSDILDRAQLLT